MQTDSCHTKSKLFGSAIEDVHPSPFASSTPSYTLVAHRRVHVLAHCSLKYYQNCPFVRTLPLLRDPLQTPNPLGRCLRASWAKSVALSPVVPVTASGRYYMLLCTHVGCSAACLPREWRVGGSLKTPPAPSSSQMLS